MADTRVQLEVEDWVRQNWLGPQLAKRFSRERVPLRSGGFFDFDAVSEDRTIVATISTSGARTAGGKHAVGKVVKIRSDILFLTMVSAERRLVVLTEQDMYLHCKKEGADGRMPPEIEFHLVEIPRDLRERLLAARRRASDEMS